MIENQDIEVLSNNNTNYDDFELIKKLENTKEDVQNLWNDIVYDQSSKIKEVWKSEPSNMFRDKILDCSKYITDISDELEQIIEKYKQYTNKNIDETKQEEIKDENETETLDEVPNEQ